MSKKSIFLISRTNSLSLCERSVAHLSFCGHFAVRHRDALLVTAAGHPCPDALWALTFRHPCLPSPMGKEGSKAKLLKISRKADRDAPCDQARMLDSVRTEVVSTDAYKWSNRVGARCTDHTRPQMHRCKTHKRTQTCIGASPKARML